MSEVAIAGAELGLSPTRRLRRRFPYLIGSCFLVIGVVVVWAIFGPLIAPHDPNQQNLLVGLSSPSKDFWLGTDDLGRDVFSRVIVGARTAIVGPIIIAIGAMLIGNTLGLIAGYRGGAVDATIMRWVDLMWALPGLLIAIVVVGVLGGGYWLAVALLILLTAPYDTRIVRGATLEQRPLPYVEAARTLGLRDRRIMLRHIWPNVLPLVVANTFLNFAFALVTLSALSFLGLGVGPGTPDWGRMLAESRTLLFDNPWAALGPGLMIVITAASMNLIGDWFYEWMSDRGPGAVSAGPLLEVRSLRIESRIEGLVQTIVTGLDLEVYAGETVGIVGESGSGKSMTARALIGLLPRGVYASGEIRYGGHDLLTLPERRKARFRGREIGLVFQDPFTMLNPLSRCGKQITEVLRDEHGHRLSREARHAEGVRRLREVGIHDAGVAHRYPFQLSGGMRQRVGIAAALARDPRLLIADEPSTALDVTTQKEILALLKSLQASRGMGLILITHDLRVAFSMCDRVSVLYAGSLLESGPADALESEPLHPYTLGLLLSEPPANRRLSQLVSIGGPVPRPDDVASVCAFSPRCRWAQPVCLAPTPLAQVGNGRESACVRIDEIAPELAAARESAEREVHLTVAGSSRNAVARVSELRKVFEPASRREGGATVVAIDGVSLEVGEGESVGLVGESGSGKTTLARCMVGLETPTSGTILVDGLHAENFRRLNDRDRRRLRRTVQIIFQDPYSSLNPVMTVGATLREALAVGGSSGRPEASLVALLDRVGLPASYAQRKPVALSGGERQRVAIARALAVKPRLIVCDEPVSALDVSVQAQILNLLKALREEFEMSYLFITHDLAVVRQVVERVYVLFRGRVVEEGPVDEVLDAPKHEYTVKLVDSVPRSETEWLRAARG